MPLGSDEVKRIAHLARLALPPDTVDAYARDLSSILTFVEQLEAVDTQGIQPMAHPQESKQRLRPDVVTESDQSARFQSLAPRAEMGLYLVPKVIE